jgi:hypothetical protein
MSLHGGRESGVGSRESQGKKDAETGRHGDAERKLTTNNQPLTIDLAQNSKLKTQNPLHPSPAYAKMLEALRFI